MPRHLPTARTALIDAVARTTWTLNRLRREREATLLEPRYLRLEEAIARAEVAKAELVQALELVEQLVKTAAQEHAA